MSEFQILRITEDIIDSLVQEDGELQINLLCRTYLSKVKELCSAYKRYCSGIKKADCVLANKSRNSNSDFCRFLHKPEIPRRRPDITTFIHKPLEHYREVLKLLTVVQSLTKSNHEDYSVINQVVQEMQLTYREITSEAGLMEPTGGGRPLLTVQDLENRLVFTKCKPFILNKPGRQWIFGSDLSRIEGRNVRQYWTLLFSDLLLFAKVSRDRVLFIIEDPLPLAHITDMLFNVRKKDTEFRISVSPEGRSAESPTIHCGPDLSRTPKKGSAKKTIILRAPTIELKAVWQNLLQRQILYINAGMEGSSLSSPLESPDAPITSSVATLQSAESLSLRRQVRLNSGHCSQPVVISRLPALTPLNTLTRCNSPTLVNQASLTKTPDSPSANVSSATSEHSQAFSSHFNSQTNLLSHSYPPCNEQSQSLLTPSPEFSSEADAQFFEEFEFLKFGEDSWDISNFDYDLISLNIDDTSIKSCQSN
ncbi:hypothetical protein HHI36_013538 [Cryptolaemus montrouzieri]|uniref:DH domain-containing protein n=1 Tax=Cryptolaemus montrouzieri TaxID=559131 RepID=A0ABD2NHW9_9CUCU